MLKYIISYLAKLTPNHYYFSEDSYDIARKENSRKAIKTKRSVKEAAIISFLCAMNESDDSLRSLETGDEMHVDIEGLLHGNKNIGNYEVTIKRK